MMFFHRSTSFIRLTLSWGIICLISERMNSQKTCEPKKNCLPPDCRCNTEGSPVNIPVKDIPQMVIFTFDDAVRHQDYTWYRRLFASDRVNPNGCSICMTLFLQDKYTNYDSVRELHNYGMEIAVHSVTHRLPGDFWKSISRDQFIEEACGQKQNIHRKAGVPLDKIRGWRSPYLQPSGETQYSVLQACNFTYDSTLTISKSSMKSENPWPFTLDFGWPLQCGVPPCPAESYAGFWVFPIITLITPQNHPAIYVDSHRPNSAQESFQFLWNNFQSYYTQNRSPFMLNMHTAWFYFPQNLEGMDRFIKQLLTLPDVYIVTLQQAMDWMKKPVSVSNISQLTSWECSEPKPAPRATEKTTPHSTTSTTMIPTATTTSQAIPTTVKAVPQVTSTTTTPQVTSATVATTQHVTTAPLITSKIVTTTPRERTTPQVTTSPITTGVPPLPITIAVNPLTTTSRVMVTGVPPLPITIAVKPLTTTSRVTSTSVPPLPITISVKPLTTTSRVISTSVLPLPITIAVKPLTPTPLVTSTSATVLPNTTTVKPIIITSQMTSTRVTPLPVTITVKPLTTTSRVTPLPITKKMVPPTTTPGVTSSRETSPQVTLEFTPTITTQGTASPDMTSPTMTPEETVPEEITHKTPVSKPPDTHLTLTTKRLAYVTTTTISPPRKSHPPTKPLTRSSTAPPTTAQTTRTLVITPTKDAVVPFTPKTSESTTGNMEPTTTTTVSPTTSQPDVRAIRTTTSVLITKLIDHEDEKKKGGSAIDSGTGNSSDQLVLDLWLLAILATYTTFVL